MRHHGKRIAGRNYVPSCGRCDVPPGSCAPVHRSALMELNARTVAPVMVEARERTADRINAEADARLAFVMGENTMPKLAGTR
jgi:hypothetical protein